MKRYIVVKFDNQYSFSEKCSMSSQWITHLYKNCGVNDLNILNIGDKKTDKLFIKVKCNIFKLRKLNHLTLSPKNGIAIYMKESQFKECYNEIFNKRSND